MKSKFLEIQIEDIKLTFQPNKYNKELESKMKEMFIQFLDEESYIHLKKRFNNYFNTLTKNADNDSKILLQKLKRALFQFYIKDIMLLLVSFTEDRSGKPVTESKKIRKIKFNQLLTRDTFWFFLPFYTITGDKNDLYRFLKKSRKFSGLSIPDSNKKLYLEIANKKKESPTISWRNCCFIVANKAHLHEREKSQLYSRFMKLRRNHNLESPEDIIRFLNSK